LEDEDWPITSGDYVLGNLASPVAVLIVGRGAVDVPTDLFCIKGILKTENLGLEKVIVNIISRPSIRVLVVCGKEEYGHFPGNAIDSLMKNGIDDHRRIIGTSSAIPFLCDLPPEAVARFREQVLVVDLLDTSNVGEQVAYDPIYEFSEDGRSELLGTLQELSLERLDAFPAEPIIVRARSFNGESCNIAKQMYLASDDFISPMLRIASDELSTGIDLMVVSNEFGVLLEPLQGRVLTVPSVELALRMRSYLTGG
jgi:tetrahydromethanopterin S-methyltransferase subunit A